MGLRPGDAKKIAAFWSVLFVGGVGFFFVAKRDVDRSRAETLEASKRIAKELEAQKDAEKTKEIVLEASDQKKS